MEEADTNFLLGVTDQKKSWDCFMLYNQAGKGDPPCQVDLCSVIGPGATTPAGATNQPARCDYPPGTVFRLPTRLSGTDSRKAVEKEMCNTAQQNGFELAQRRSARVDGSKTRKLELYFCCSCNMSYRERRGHEKKFKEGCLSQSGTKTETLKQTKKKKEWLIEKEEARKEKAKKKKKGGKSGGKTTGTKKSGASVSSAAKAGGGAAGTNSVGASVLGAVSEGGEKGGTRPVGSSTSSAAATVGRETSGVLPSSTPAVAGNGRPAVAVNPAPVLAASSSKSAATTTSAAATVGGKTSGTRPSSTPAVAASSAPVPAASSSKSAARRMSTKKPTDKSKECPFRFVVFLSSKDDCWYVASPSKQQKLMSDCTARTHLHHNCVDPKFLCPRTEHRDKEHDEFIMDCKNLGLSSTTTALLLSRKTGDTWLPKNVQNISAKLQMLLGGLTPDASSAEKLIEFFEKR